MKKLFTFFCAIFCSIIGFSQIVNFTNIINGAPDNSSYQLASGVMNSLESLSNQFSGMYKANAVDASPQVYYSTTDKWPDGAWGRGYESKLTDNQFYNTQTDAGYYYSCKPLNRNNAQFLAGHLHNYVQGINPINNLVKVKQGIDFLLSEKVATTVVSQTPVFSGTVIDFKWNVYRESQIDMNSDDSNAAGFNLYELVPYETSTVLQVLCDYYMSNIPYRRVEVLESIRMATDAIRTYDWCNTYNSNTCGLAIWALANSYKVTRDCETMVTIKEMTYRLLVDQSEDGQWRTGTCEEVKDENGQAAWARHDQQITYHFFTLRGLIEVFSILPQENFNDAIVQAIKKGINHVILQRITYDSQVGNYDKGFLKYHDVVAPSGSSVIALPEYYFDINNSIMVVFFETIAELNFYAQGSFYFNDQERTSLRNVLTMMAKWGNINNSSNLQNLNDDEQWFFPAMAMFESYSNSIDNKTKLFGWAGDTPNYTAKLISNTTVTGDFDNDGFMDDIAGFKGYGPLTTAIHVWNGDTPSSLEYRGDNASWVGNQFDVTKILGRVVSGDFDNDGYFDDIAVVYDEGNNNTKVWVFASNGSTFTVTNYYANPTFNASNPTNRVVSGDFDNDSFHDDIALFYSYGGNSTKVWVLEGAVSAGVGSFSIEDYFSTTTDFNANNVTGNLVSGDFDNDGFHDDIITFYDYGNGTTNAFQFQSNSNSFTTSTFWNGQSMSGNQASTRYVSGDFDNDGFVDDVTAMFSGGGNIMNMWVFLSSGTDFPTNLVNSYYTSTTYNANNVSGRVVCGDFTQDFLLNDIMVLYDYGTSCEWHCFEENQNEFTLSTYWDQNTKNCSNDYTINTYLTERPCFKTPPSCYSKKRSQGQNDVEENNLNAVKSYSTVVYPNPVKNVLFVQSEGEIINIELVDMSGRSLKKSNSKQLSIVEFEPGSYLLNIYFKSHTESKVVQIE